MKSILELRDSIPWAGSIEWIGIRPARREPVVSVTATRAIAGVGLEGDHRSTRTPDVRSTRHLTLIQWEHLPVIFSLLCRDATKPELLRRNIAVSGINLLALKDRKFRVGEVLCEGTGLCHPCSRMEEVLGIGGYNAVRGHGGITARILGDGWIRVGDRVEVAE